MEVSLTPEMERWVTERVKAGEFESESAAVCAGLLLLQKREAEARTKLDALRRDVQVGLDQLDRGEAVDGEEAFEQVLAWIAEPVEKSA